MNCYDEYENKDFKLFFNYGYLVNIDNNRYHIKKIWFKFK